jgi:hypothetical protein
MEWTRCNAEQAKRAVVISQGAIANAVMVRCNITSHRKTAGAVAATRDDWS